MLELEDGSIDLVDEDDGLDLFLAGLPQHGFSLNANTFNAVNNDQGSVSDSEGGSDL